MHNSSTTYYNALYYAAPICSDITKRQTVYTATTQYFLRIPRQNNFIVAGTISTFLMSLNFDKKTYVNF